MKYRLPISRQLAWALSGYWPTPDGLTLLPHRPPHPTMATVLAGWL